MNFWRFRAAAHISRANCTEIARDRLGQPAYETVSIKRSFYLFKFRPPPLRSRNYPYGEIKLEYPLQNTCIWLLKRQQPRETVAPSGVCKCIVPNVSCWDRLA